MIFSGFLGAFHNVLPGKCLRHKKSPLQAFKLTKDENTFPRYHLCSRICTGLMRTLIINQNSEATFTKRFLPRLSAYDRNSLQSADLCYSSSSPFYMQLLTILFYCLLREKSRRNIDFLAYLLGLPACLMPVYSAISLSSVTRLSMERSCTEVFPVTLANVLSSSRDTFRKFATL